MLSRSELKPGVIYRVTGRGQATRFQVSWIGCLVIIFGATALKIIKKSEWGYPETDQIFPIHDDSFDFEIASDYMIGVEKLGYHQHETIFERKKDIIPGFVYELVDVYDPSLTTAWKGCLLTLMPYDGKIRPIVIQSSPEDFPAIGQYFKRKVYKPKYRLAPYKLIPVKKEANEYIQY